MVIIKACIQKDEFQSKKEMKNSLKELCHTKQWMDCNRHLCDLACVSSTERIQILYTVHAVQTDIKMSSTCKKNLLSNLLLKI